MKSGKIILIFALAVGIPLAYGIAQEAVPPAEEASNPPAAAPAPAPVPVPTPPVAPVPPSKADKFGTPEDAPPSSASGKTAPGPLQIDSDLMYLNATDVDIKDMIKQISKFTGTNFLIDDKTRGKITIISEKPMTKEMAYQAFLSALEVMGYTTVATPGGLTKIVATKDAITEPLDIYKDETPYTDKFITRIIQVINISANDIASVVKTLISKEGNLFAYPATNSLIMTDTGSNIDRILKIIKELDQEGPQEVIEIIPIQHADASNVTEKVLELFQDEASAGKVGAAARKGRAGGAELEEVPSISKVITDERTNSVIVLGTKRAIIKMRSLIAQLDSPATGVEGTIHVHYLKNANAKEIAGVLSSLVGDVGAKDADKKGDTPKRGAVQLEGGVKVTADEGTNALVITASAKDFQTLVSMVIDKLDIPRRQVYLEAVVMELTVNKNRTLGLGGNLGNVLSIGGEKL
ncbi:MAG: secretin N-terminal domain-containing protein, partial [Deltaproteobacteria bacterium]|nr:secretin N-terminal domain-containing protein [Deltaproteobacteria bacterium]